MNVKVKYYKRGEVWRVKYRLCFLWFWLRDKGPYSRWIISFDSFAAAQASAIRFRVAYRKWHWQATRTYEKYEIT